MRVEPGGRASKYGNEYENRYLARLLLRVVNEEATSVTVEPLGEFSDSIEYCSTAEDGSVDYYQCKVSNGAQKSWTVASLQKYDVFSRAKKILTSEPRARYHFISPLTYNELDALCIRARTTASPDEFINFSLTNKDIRSAYESCSRAFDANNDNAGLKNLLSRCEFEQVPFTESATQDLNERIGLILTGNAESARVLLENYANSFSRYGVRITAKELQDYLGESGHYLRGAVHDHRALQRIEVLNRDYWDKCPGIDGKMLNRDAAKQAIQEIEDGYSIILHGKAGAGKSGCLQEIVETLKERNTLYLSVKLDKFIPEDSADKFGKTLGLPQSPVYTLANLAAENLCVLLLDQLDALRWTSKHSSTALQVCKEMMSQAAAVNNYQGGKVSIVFAARTFDLENDPGLQKLFESNGEENSTTLNSRRILVDVFSEEEAVQVIGPSYHDFSPRLKKLLRTPSSLYVWAKLSPDKRSDRIVSVREMMSKHNHLDFCTYEFEKIRGFLHLIHQFHSRFCFHRAN